MLSFFEMHFEKKTTFLTTTTRSLRNASLSLSLSRLSTADDNSAVR